MAVVQLNSFYTLCEVERTQLITILSMSAKNTQLACFLLTQNRNFFYMLKAQLPGFMIVLLIFLNFLELNNAMIQFPLITLTLSCMLILSLAKLSNMLIKYLVETTHKMLSLLTLTLISIRF